MLGVQVKRTAPPRHFAMPAWRRMEAEARRLGWLWVVASVDADGLTVYLDPKKRRLAKGANLGGAARIENLLAWLDKAASAERGGSQTSRGRPRRRAVRA